MNPAPNGPRGSLFVPCMVFAGLCSFAMWQSPGEETIPYHIAWIAICVVYGNEAWPWGRTVAAVIAYTLVTGGILVSRAANGVVGWQETAEIPLMSALVLIVLWNVRRRHLAHASLSAMAERDRERAARTERLGRMTSHEMRTPATIAMGYTEMLLRQETDEARRSDLSVIRDELGRLVLAGDRIVRTMRMHDEDDLREHDVRALLADVAERWSVLADRNWMVTCESMHLICSPGRLRACLDTLVENAVRYTEPGDTVRIIGRVQGDDVVLGVADSGPGMDPLLLSEVNRADFLAMTRDSAYVAQDPKAQTGLGLALVWEAAAARGGYLSAGVAEEGGALVTVVLPRRPRTSATSAGLITDDRPPVAPDVQPRVPAW